MKKRDKDPEGINLFYQRIELENERLCFYCEEEWDRLTDDHAYPVSVLMENLKTGEPIPMTCLYIVRACVPCNTVLKNYVFSDMEERRVYAVWSGRHYRRTHRWCKEFAWRETPLVKYGIRPCHQERQLQRRDQK